MIPEGCPLTLSYAIFLDAISNVAGLWQNAGPMKIGLKKEMNSNAKLMRKLPLPLRIFGFYPALAVALIISGCASQPPVALDAVGPAPTASAHLDSGQGALLVYSPLVAVANLEAELSGQPSDDWGYSDYRILSANGKHFKFVLNNAGTVQLHPQKVELPAGRYIVIAGAGNGLRVTVPVVVASHQTTVLHLDGGNFQPVETGFNQTNAVHLPDGRIVGWRAVTERVPTS